MTTLAKLIRVYVEYVIVEHHIDKINELIDEEIDRNNVHEMSDKSLKNASKKIAENSPEIVSNIMGKNVKDKVSNKAKRKVETDIYQYLKKTKKIGKLENKQNIEQFQKLTKRQLNKSLSDTFDKQITDTSDMQWISKEIEERLKKAQNALNETPIKEYNTCIEEFVKNVNETDNSAEILHSILEQIPHSDEQIIVEESLDIFLDKQLQLFKKTSPNSRSDIENIIKTYKKINDILEKKLPQLIWINEKIQGNDPDFDTLRSMPLNNYISKIESYENLNPLVQGLDREMRNSIGHTDRTISPHQENIKFYDEGKVVASYSIEEYISEVKNILALLVIVWKYEALILQKELSERFLSYE